MLSKVDWLCSTALASNLGVDWNGTTCSWSNWYAARVAVMLRRM